MKVSGEMHQLRGRCPVAAGGVFIGRKLQMFGIGDVLRAARGAFVICEVPAIDKIYRYAVNIDHITGLITFFELYTIQTRQDVDTVGGISELDYLTFFKEVARVQIQRTEPKVIESFQNLTGIDGRQQYPYIQVFGISRVAVQSDGITSDDHIPDIIFV